MTIDRKIKLAAALVAVVMIAACIGYVWQGFRVRTLEREAAAFEDRARTATREADEWRVRAQTYSDRIGKLESGLAEIEAIARRQDEELKKLGADSNSARVGVERARRVRAVGTNAAELCRRLAELGHGC